MRHLTILRNRQQRHEAARAARYRHGFGQVVAHCALDKDDPTMDEMALLKAALGSGLVPSDPDFWPTLEGALHGLKFVKRGYSHQPPEGGNDD